MGLRLTFWVNAFFIFSSLLFSQFTLGAQTSGGVQWLDSLAYEKPAFYPLTVPDEASCPNKYYVDLTAGEVGRPVVRPSI